MKVILRLAMLLSLVTTASSAFAIEAEDPCTADVKKFCADAGMNKEKIFACLKNNHDKLSQSCKQRGLQAKATTLGLMKVCKSDAEKFCKKITEDAALTKCLKKNKAKLSLMCKSKMNVELPL